MFVLTIAGAASAEQLDGADKISLALGPAKGPAGGTVLVDVSITGADGLERIDVEQDIRFDNRLVSYVRAQPTAAGLGSGLEVTASVRADSQDSKYSILHLEAIAGKPLPSRAVIGIVFSINDAAKIDTVATLNTTAWIRTPQGRRKVAATAAAVTVIEGVKPVFVCFFYMH